MSDGNKYNEQKQQQNNSEYLETARHGGCYF